MASHGKARELTLEALRARQPFKRNGFAMWASTDQEGTGYLPEPHLAEYRAAQRERRIVYTVMSYATPIAWVLEDGTKVQPPVKYSRTTSQHQGMLYVL